jgi:predicted HAD superfamily Cof-like phosphohydrolase
MSFVIFRDQKSFMQYFRQFPSEEVADLYKTLVDEEYRELQEAWVAYKESPTPEAVTEIADACLDLIYVATGLMHGLGLDPQPLWNEVHRSNVDKIKHPCNGCNADGRVALEHADINCPDCKGQRFIYEARYREDGKVLKPPHWQPPQIGGLVRMMLEGHKVETGPLE